MADPQWSAEMEAVLQRFFTYQKPKPEQAERYEQLRAGARSFAAMILLYTPKCADQTVALRKLREAVMTANAAIACEEI